MNDAVHFSGVLTAIAFHACGLPRRQRPTRRRLVEVGTARLREELTQQLSVLARRSTSADFPAAGARARAYPTVGAWLDRRYRHTRVRAYRLMDLRDHLEPSWIEVKLRDAFTTVANPDAVYAAHVAPNLIVNSGEAYWVDAWQGIVEPEIMKYHGAGTGATAAAEADTALQAESTTVLNPPSTRATGSLAEAAANIFRTVGTLTFSGAATITEWGLFNQAATGGGVMWSRVVSGSLGVLNGDSIQWTYDATVE
jgi:hypothetical protein